MTAPAKETPTRTPEDEARAHLLLVLTDMGYLMGRLETLNAADEVPASVREHYDAARQFATGLG